MSELRQVRPRLQTNGKAAPMGLEIFEIIELQRGRSYGATPTGLDGTPGREQFSHINCIMPDSRNDDLKGLWAIFWRVLILVPFLWILGFGLLPHEPQVLPML